MELCRSSMEFFLYLVFECGWQLKVSSGDYMKVETGDKGIESRSMEMNVSSENDRRITRRHCKL